MVSAVFALSTAVCIGLIISLSKYYQHPPASLLERNLTCEAKPSLCSFSDERAPDQPNRSGRWRKASLQPYFMDELTVQFKRWQYVGFSNDQFFVGAAFVRFSYISDVFLYLVDRHSKQVFTYTGRLPFGIGITSMSSTLKGCTKWGTSSSDVLNATRDFMELCAREGGGFRFRANLPISNSEDNREEISPKPEDFNT